nr:unnamed protein product [Digitaria exilis]
MTEGAMEKVKLVAGVLVLEALIAGFHVVSRVALDMGVSKMAFLVYRNASALAVVAPFAYFLEKKDRPPVTLHLMAEFFILTVFGITFTQGFYILGLYYLSPTYVSVIQNSIPAITFVMASCLRLEQVNVKTGYGLAKVVPVLKKYPAKLSLFAIILAMGLIQLLAVAPFFDNDIMRWKVHSGGELLSILYAGIVATGLAWSLKIWCINKGGPLFVAVFQPLQTVMVAIMAAVFLGDQLYSGG